jgi:hypothetical protein
VLVRAREGRVYNPIGFLVTAVPKCFAREALRSYREQKGREQEIAEKRDLEEQVALEKWRKEQEASLANPNIPEQEKHLIRLCLGLNET